MGRGQNTNSFNSSNSAKALLTTVKTRRFKEKEDHFKLFFSNPTEKEFINLFKSLTPIQIKNHTQDILNTYLEEYYPNLCAPEEFADQADSEEDAFYNYLKPRLKKNLTLNELEEIKKDFAQREGPSYGPITYEYVVKDMEKKIKEKTFLSTKQRYFLSEMEGNEYATGAKDFLFDVVHAEIKELEEKELIPLVQNDFNQARDNILEFFPEIGENIFKKHLFLREELALNSLEELMGDFSLDDYENIKVQQLATISNRLTNDLLNADPKDQKAFYKIICESIGREEDPSFDGFGEDEKETIQDHFWNLISKQNARKFNPTFSSRDFEIFCDLMYEDPF